MLLLQGGCSEVFGMSERDIFKIKETGVLINLEGTDVLEAGKSYVLTKTGGEPGPAGKLSLVKLSLVSARALPSHLGCLPFSSDQ
eukprot:m.222345 g.222345  ORF g.222345 m.222345 type:complete len:85 (-) comp15623_c0_seq2:4603-4857(-)